MKPMGRGSVDGCSLNLGTKFCPMFRNKPLPVFSIEREPKVPNGHLSRFEFGQAIVSASAGNRSPVIHPKGIIALTEKCWSRGETKETKNVGYQFFWPALDMELISGLS
jgi:hypothetical protein